MVATNKRALELPEQYAESILAAARDVDQRIQYDFAAAIESANEELRLLRIAQAESGRRLHKGHPLHNLGVAWLRRDPGSARVYFLGAHAEDIRLWPRLRPTSWAFLAERMLRQIFRETTETIRRLERAARRQPMRDPVDLAEYVVRELPPPRFPERVESTLSEEDLRTVPAGRRIFVGGSYGASMDRIDVIERAVRGRAFEPVVVAQYASLRDERPRPKSFRLLDMCAAAVFEGTAHHEPGWWPELERIVQIHPKPTLVAFLGHHATSELHTSSMFPRKEDMAGLETLPWGDPDHLRAVVEWWLDRLTPPTGPPAFLLGTRPMDDPLVITVPSGSPYLGGSATPYERGTTPASNAALTYELDEDGEEE